MVQPSWTASFCKELDTPEDTQLSNGGFSWQAGLYYYIRCTHKAAVHRTVLNVHCMIKHIIQCNGILESQCANIFVGISNVIFFNLLKS